MVVLLYQVAVGHHHLRQNPLEYHSCTLLVDNAHQRGHLLSYLNWYHQPWIWIVHSCGLPRSSIYPNWREAGPSLKPRKRLEGRGTRFLYSPAVHCCKRTVETSKIAWWRMSTGSPARKTAASPWFSWQMTMRCRRSWRSWASDTNWSITHLPKCLNLTVNPGSRRRRQSEQTW